MARSSSSSSFLSIDRLFIALIILVLQVTLILETQSLIQNTSDWFTTPNDAIATREISSSSLSAVKERMVLDANPSLSLYSSSLLMSKYEDYIKERFAGMDDGETKSDFDVETISLEDILDTTTATTNTRGSSISISNNHNNNNNNNNKFCSAIMEAKAKQQTASKGLVMNIVYNCKELAIQNNDDDVLGRWITSIYSMRQQSLKHGVGMMLTCSDISESTDNNKKMMVADQVMPWMNGYWPPTVLKADEKKKEGLHHGIANTKKTSLRHQQQPLLVDSDDDDCGPLEHISQILPEIRSDLRRMATSIFRTQPPKKDNDNSNKDKDSTNKEERLQQQQQVQLEQVHNQSQVQQQQQQQQHSSNNHSTIEQIDEVAIHFDCEEWMININEGDDNEEEEGKDEDGSYIAKRFSSLSKNNKLDLTNIQSIGIITTDSFSSQKQQKQQRRRQGWNQKINPRACQTIRQELKEYLTEAYPRARVSLHDVDELKAISFARLIMADRATIVSTSSTLASLAAMSSYGVGFLWSTKGDYLTELGVVDSSMPEQSDDIIVVMEEKKDSIISWF